MNSLQNRTAILGLFAFAVACPSTPGPNSSSNNKTSTPATSKPAMSKAATQKTPAASSADHWTNCTHDPDCSAANIIPHPSTQTPGNLGCPDCVRFSRETMAPTMGAKVSYSSLDFNFQIKDVAADDKIADPVLVLARGDVEQRIALSLVSATDAWAPGKLVKVLKLAAPKGMTITAEDLKKDDSGARKLRAQVVFKLTRASTGSTVTRKHELSFCWPEMPSTPASCGKW